MDIVKRAFLNVYEANKGLLVAQLFKEQITDEMKRMIKVRVYSGRDWPREFGPLPDELRSKRGRGSEN